jgi:purine-binding chemotaxis protein CheW
LNDRVLEFAIGKELFAVDILEVQEVIPVPPLTPMPSQMRSFKGMINLRGLLIPVFDLKEKLGIRNSSDEVEPGVVIVKMEEISIGLLVDKICQVLFIKPSMLSEKASVINQINPKYVRFVHQSDDHLTVILSLKDTFKIQSLKSLLDHSAQSESGEQCQNSA